MFVLVLVSSVQPSHVEVSADGAVISTSCDYTPLELVPPFMCAPDKSGGACKLAQVCKPFRGMREDCILGLSGLSDELFFLHSISRHG